MKPCPARTVRGTACGAALSALAGPRWPVPSRDPLARRRREWVVNVDQEIRVKRRRAARSSGHYALVIDVRRASTELARDWPGDGRLVSSMTTPGRPDLSDRVIPEPRQPGGRQACGGDLGLPAGDDRGQVFPAGSCCRLTALCLRG